MNTGGFSGLQGCPRGDFLCSFSHSWPSNCLPISQLGTPIPDKLHASGGGLWPLPNSLPEEWKMLRITLHKDGDIWVPLGMSFKLTKKNKNKKTTSHLPAPFISLLPESVLPMKQRPSLSVIHEDLGSSPVQSLLLASHYCFRKYHC